MLCAFAAFFGIMSFRCISWRRTRRVPKLRESRKMTRRGVCRRCCACVKCAGFVSRLRLGVLFLIFGLLCFLFGRGRRFFALDRLHSRSWGNRSRICQGFLSFRRRGSAPKKRIFRSAYRPARSEELPRRSFRRRILQIVFVPLFFNRERELFRVV